MKNYLVLDIETTGLSRHQHKITEIAALEIRHGRIHREFQTLINPETHIPRFITHLTGIDDQMVKNAPTIEEALPTFLQFAQDKIAVAHNATFDHGFLHHHASLLGSAFDNETVCTRKLATRLLPELPSKKLGMLCEHFKIENDQAHRALSDAKATHLVFTNMLQLLEKAEIKTEKEIISFERFSPQRAQKLLQRHRSS